MMKALVLVAALEKNGKFSTKNGMALEYASYAQKRGILTKQLITNEPLRQLFPQKIGGVNTGIHEASLKQERTNRFVVLAGMIIVIILVITIIVIIIIIVISL